MSILLYRGSPTTPGGRGLVRVKKDFLWKGGPERSLVKSLKNTGGRNNKGRITCNKINPLRRKYRIVDFKRKDDFLGRVEHLEYDPNRSAYLALVQGVMQSQDGIDNKTIKKYILATQNMTPGMVVSEGKMAGQEEGHCLKLLNIRVGDSIHNLELRPGGGAKLVRGAGACAQLMGKQEGYALVKLPSGEVRKFPLECRATRGVVSNILKYNTKLGKAGHTRNILHRRPKVRGVAKNPVDHCNGGKTSGGKVLSNYQGNMIKGKKTRRKNHPSDKCILVKRRRK